MADFISTTTHRRSSYLIGCMSPSCVPVHEEYKLINRSVNRRNRRWKKLMKKMVEESKKSIYGSSKPLVFTYDAVSYSQNFDEGNHCECDKYRVFGSRFSQGLRECS
ncbi:hypothetical protein QVD17_10103 [Tagetes erecta]|uniref:Uncharacterized protein n=1 Tax=Tagetes erecta TaxID=13708 RepID=A0AAD8L8M3_TARER|nr:hypothetical protein QVD17_10103 [Tagetes erecta]